jgi:hypothetical protein
MADGRRRMDPSVVRDRAKTVARLATLAGSESPATGLQALRALRYHTDRLELYSVAYARSLRWSWRDISESLGVSKQVLHRRYARVFPRPRRHRARRPRGPVS